MAGSSGRFGKCYVAGNCFHDVDAGNIAASQCRSAPMSHQLHKTWLKVTALVVGSFGPVFFLGTMEATQDLLDWPVDGATGWASPDTRFLSALTGGFLTGWGVMIWCLAARVYDVAPEAVRKSVVTGLLAWFCIDSAGSIASGSPSNAFFNVAVLALAVGPLWRPARD
jgi:hypothetical protein